MNYRIKLLIVHISINNKLRDLVFGYIIAVIMTVVSTTFLRNQWVLLKLQPNLLNIVPIELKPGLWIKCGMVNISTKF